MRPRIAMPADTLTEATNIINERNADFTPRMAVNAVLKSGGLPVILPNSAPENVADYLDSFDGVLFLGGFDVDPTFYNEEPDMNLGQTYIPRDEFEIELVKQAVAAGKSIFGICRGMQVINVALGGTLYQDLSEDPTAKLKHAQTAPGNLPTHHVTVEKNSRLYKIMGERPYVNSRHHEAVKLVAPSLNVVARSDDQVVEAVESKVNNQILAVQWHPENMYKHAVAMQDLFRDFIQRSGAAALAKTAAPQLKVVK
ncbi:gamma-glutamyl-gamma-aminobutyrate hydrolase family protein [Loigolactobacillus backii]|uniref:Gamma-glutamyl-gamma-aminobutyrate hydrolase n=1 Tax=Loigolactobacillus backii TaxID=375175 RepID=A0A192H0N8_9LACO|nr:gamma-glutamyl-gamma-aminobutyrate hydrolase family protein [Loigolactobacillus backii]ANK60588.1 glutamine amidotransferase [Loigolactobacillus backii]ANK61843.1 gamma-glutamyl-gamma-aminobutyrate hydrolase [Loigolactobacillus backii]ANK65541.1 gamma-glutamyl-gamma-aminobutyrate hydrolase [Loigolactobacillus backii]ANK68012.1 gamma-glutamyl-gamma-aminobutyrate hydrolase [Loigolactobacillus backii]ANK68963.1 gamma-glutamyl-gamma-aminobutyrate hydrolase [Loigolactobacillus backii]